MEQAKFAYIPLYPGRTFAEDKWRLARVDPHFPAGDLIATVDGSEPRENRWETLQGRYAERITRQDAENAFGVDWVNAITEFDVVEQRRLDPFTYRIVRRQQPTIYDNGMRIRQVFDLERSEDDVPGWSFIARRFTADGARSAI